MVKLRSEDKHNSFDVQCVPQKGPGSAEKKRTILKVSLILMNEISKDAESKIFESFLIILEVWTNWRLLIKVFFGP